MIFVNDMSYKVVGRKEHLIINTKEKTSLNLVNKIDDGMNIVNK